MQVHHNTSHDVDFRFDTLCCWLHSTAKQGRATQLLKSCCSRTWWCFEDQSTMQSTMNSNGLQRQGSQENYILDNTLRKKCSLWYRRSLKGNNDRHRQNTGSLPRVRKVRVWSSKYRMQTHTHTHNTLLQSKLHQTIIIIRLKLQHFLVI